MSVMDQIVARIIGTEPLLRSEVSPAGLPPDSPGALTNDGAGTLSWSPTPTLDTQNEFTDQNIFDKAVIIRNNQHRSYQPLNVTGYSEADSSIDAANITAQLDGNNNYQRPNALYALVYSTIPASRTILRATAVYCGSSGGAQNSGLITDLAGVYVSHQAIRAHNMYGVWVSKPAPGGGQNPNTLADTLNVAYFNENMTGFAGAGKDFAWYSEGGTNHVETGSAATVGLEIIAHAGQTANLSQWLASDEATVFCSVSPNGYFTTRKNAAPADAELVAGEAAYWFDPTNGAAKFMIKAKQANGTVVSAAIALA
jgi:hypothetical protein